MGWLRRHQWIKIAAFLTAGVLIVAGFWLLWHVLASYIGPKGPTGRKDFVQVFALIVAGIVGIIGAAGGLLNVWIARRNLEHNQESLRSQLYSQRELEDKRTQDAALQSYFEHMGSLLTDHDLIGADREDLNLLARAQTLTVLARLDGTRKGDLIRFLHAAGLIDQNKLIVVLAGADLTDAELVMVDLENANLSNVNLIGANLSMANLIDANLSWSTFYKGILTNANLGGANLIYARFTSASLHDADLIGAKLINADLSRATLLCADLTDADLTDANLTSADLTNADLTNAEVTKEQLATCESLEGATMPNGQKYERLA